MSKETFSSVNFYEDDIVRSTLSSLSAWSECEDDEVIIVSNEVLSDGLGGD